MTDQSIEASNQSAQDAAGPPPGADALTRSGLVDHPKGYVRTVVDRVADFFGGNTRSDR